MSFCKNRYVPIVGVEQNDDLTPRSIPIRPEEHEDKRKANKECAVMRCNLPKDTKEKKRRKMRKEEIKGIAVG